MDPLLRSLHTAYLWDEIRHPMSLHSSIYTEQTDTENPVFVLVNPKEIVQILFLII